MFLGDSLIWRDYKSMFRMKRLYPIFLIFLCLSEISKAQISVNPSASEILLRMKKLNVLGSVLYIAAHPDDENTRLLAWLSKDKLYRTGYLSLTRGDGGQNLIGDEQGIELGLIRTEELLAARQIDGAEQFFARAYDFGFSKTTTEALTLWDEQKMLSDVVWIIRKFQPDIIITRFPEDKRAGHGQHSASSVLARLAFSAAADPKQFPEQFRFGVQPWQATRLFWNTYRFGSFNTTSEDQLKIEVGGFNPLIGKSYGEIAADSRSQHRSQGFGATHTRGSQLEYFMLTAGEKTDSSLMQHINCTWSRIPQGAAIGTMTGNLINNFNPAAPYNSLPLLLEIYKSISALPPGYWRTEKLKETVELIQACSGLWLEATVEGPYAGRNQTIPVTIKALNRSPVSIILNSVSLNRQDTSCNQPLGAGINYSLVRHISLENLPISQPYWLIEPMSPGSYNVQDQTLIGQPQNPPSLEAIFSVNFSGTTLSFRQKVFYRYTDAVKGEMYQPLTIVPGLMAYAIPSLLVFTKGQVKDLSMVYQRIASHYPEDERMAFRSTLNKGNLTVEAPSSISFTPLSGFETSLSAQTPASVVFKLKSDEAENRNELTWLTKKQNEQTDTIFQCRTISYDHIPRIDYFKPSNAMVVSVNLKTRGTRIGYIEGAGDKVPDALTAMGYTVVKLDENSITTEILKNLDAVIAGVRAYDVHEWMAGKYNILMNYVSNGGNLIVQYNRNRADDTTGLGPYPFGISNNRVTEEDAPVQFLQPENSFFHFPNEITSKDFEGWIQERGIYFASHIDSRYQSLLSMHDKDEPQQIGSLIIGKYGKGNFCYTGLVFFRELPAGVPGSYRLLANLIALNQQKDN
jgi:LmbE family N-acetylglucosaminyl deacetylase